MGKLKELVDGLEGEALVDALAKFEYQPEEAPAGAAAKKGSVEWHEDVENGRPLGGPDTFGELAALVARGDVPHEVYAEVVARRQGDGQQQSGATPDAAGATA